MSRYIIKTMYLDKSEDKQFKTEKVIEIQQHIWCHGPSVAWDKKMCGAPLLPDSAKDGDQTGHACAVCA